MSSPRGPFEFPVLLAFFVRSRDVSCLIEEDGRIVTLLSPFEGVIGKCGLRAVFFSRPREGNGEGAESRPRAGKVTVRGPHFLIGDYSSPVFILLLQIRHIFLFQVSVVIVFLHV